MKIIEDLVINDKLNPDLKDLKCYVIIDKYVDGMGLPGYSPRKVLIYDKSSFDGCLAHPILSDIIDESSVLSFNKHNTGNNSLVITDNKLEAEMLAEQFNKFGYCSCKEELAKVYDRMMALTRFYNSMARVIESHEQQFDKTRIDNDDRAHKKFVEFAKTHYPKFLSNLSPSIWNDETHGSCVYLVGIRYDGTAVYHYPDMYGCWDVIVSVQLDDERIMGISNGVFSLDCEWYPITEADFLSSFNAGEPLDNMTGTKLSFLTNGRYK